jgi:hypothetical protein
MLYLVNDQPFLDLDYLGIDCNRLYHEAAEFMIQYPYFIPGSNGNQQRFVDDPEDIIHPPKAFNQLDDVERLRYEGFSMAQRRRYLKIKKRAFFPWNIYNLNEMGDWDDRHHERDKFFDKTQKTMPYFVSMIKSLPIFEHIGWARIYGNEAFNYIHPHRDSTVDVEIDEFIYFNLADKKMYLMHYDTEEKIYLDKRAMFFDAKNIHGTDPEPYYNFSMRVDGRFTQEFYDSLTFNRFEESLMGNAAHNKIKEFTAKPIR